MIKNPILVICLLFVFQVSSVYPQDKKKIGKVTGLEIPRFVSLKSNDVNIRVGPSINYPIKLKYVFIPKVKMSPWAIPIKM